ncbi:MAG: cytochrome c oxidase assembly protein [Proteobacteria bacterium]|nr:cytochrome c oxidase assembly protein [Pseudomonadota bacterium]
MSQTTSRTIDAAIYALIGAAATLAWWLARTHVARLPVWAPWDFSWVEFLAAWLTLFWYARGVIRLAPGERPSWLRRGAFAVGVLAIYAVLETRYEYLAEHQFFFNRLQHVTMHHLGPVLIALAWPGAALKAGLPAPLTRLATHPLLVAIVKVLQQPALAAILFVGLIFFWLVPSIHFAAMIDPRLFALMNWSMVVDGILFWCLVLDPRPAPQARTSFGVRAALTMVVMFPQIVGGAMIVFNPHDLYGFYDLCGRIYPELGAHYDQTVGGLIVWIPPAMMSVAGLLLVLNAMRRVEEQQFAALPADQRPTRPTFDARAWTG